MTELLLDTSILIEIMRRRAPGVQAKLAAVHLDSIGISIVTYAELLVGVTGSSNPAASRAALNVLVSAMQVCEITLAVAEHYAVIWPYLKRKGIHIGPNDLWIAANALALDATLVTGNVREFQRVPGLRVENWLR